ncbi:galactose-specific lectin nattectin-like [Nematolebias whitei]|uniref:galactose-specific lectin nattectin-like n=1 Tax=Nematolebias whitei TaxID=451745 RepID=UPI00189A16C5|nr:galactose-specific lectin nattectin-like [Nematolebias whitei]
MSSSLLFLLLLCGLGIGGNILCDAQPVTCKGKDCNFCPPTWSPYEECCYLFNSTEVNWDNAEESCIDQGGHLASFHNQDEYDFIQRLIVTATGTDTKAWVGGTDIEEEGVWKWSDGSSFSYTHWGSGEPNNLGGNKNCMDINVDGQDHVNDEVCSQENAFVCVQVV